MSFLPALCWLIQAYRFFWTFYGLGEHPGWLGVGFWVFGNGLPVAGLVSFFPSFSRVCWVWSIDRLIDWSLDWLIYLLVILWIDWLTDWLTLIVHVIWIFSHVPLSRFRPGIFFSYRVVFITEWWYFLSAFFVSLFCRLLLLRTAWRKKGREGVSFSVASWLTKIDEIRLLFGRRKRNGADGAVCRQVLSQHLSLLYWIMGNNFSPRDLLSGYLLGK